MRVIIFDDLKSVFHFILGFLTPFLRDLGLIVVGIYLIYQYLDKDSPQERIGDIVEFLLGVGGWGILTLAV